MKQSGAKSGTLSMTKMVKNLRSIRPSLIKMVRRWMIKRRKINEMIVVLKSLAAMRKMLKILRPSKETILLSRQS